MDMEDFEYEQAMAMDRPGKGEWQQANLQIIKIADMGHGHLINTLNMLKRNAGVVAKALRQPPEDWRKHLGDSQAKFEELEAEAKKRNLDWDRDPVVTTPAAHVAPPQEGSKANRSIKL